jgi:hypothetical protein
MEELLKDQAAMSTQTLNSVLCWSQFVAFFYLCIILPFRFVLRSGRFWRGVIFIWLTSTAFSFCSALFGLYLYQNIDRSLIDSCFEGPHVLAFAFMGWLSPGMLVSGIAYLLFWRRKQLARKSESANPQTAA